MIDKNKIIEVLCKHNYWNKLPIKNGFARPYYLEQLQSFLGNTLVKVLLGQRRCGKSRLLKMMIDYLMSILQIQPENILYINKELLDFDFIMDYQDLIKTIEIYRETLNPSGKIYLFLDEVHEISGWEMAVNSLAQDEQAPAELFITGSNAHLLSGELATFLGGRYLELMVYPFSYEEYLNAFQQVRSKASVLQYFQAGGMPELYQLQNEDVKQNYMESLVDSIVLRDIIQRNNIRDVSLLKKLIYIIADSVGSMVSISSIIKSLKHQGFKSNAETIGNYIEFCKNAFFIHECQRYDMRGKQILAGERKFYLNDLAFKTVFQSGFDSNITRILENAVYLSLRRQGYSVYVGRHGDKEIDFIAERHQEKIYIQVAYVLPDQEVIQREFGNLLLIKDNYPKWVTTLDDISLGNIQGVLHKSIWDVL